jgi:hypothetical protein
VGVCNKEMSADTTIEDLLRMQWYYSVEIAPGVITKGQDHPGGALTREALRRVKFSGRKCIDVGIQEGLFPSFPYCCAAGELQSSRPKTDFPD